jgi:hypothetical protein
MQVIRWILIFAGPSLLGGCIYEYNPEIKGSDNTLVINGKVTDQEGYQYIKISRSMAPNDPKVEHPVSNYTVEIQDDGGNSFPGVEMEPGLYGCWMDQEYLVPGKSYRLNVTSDRGNLYVSDFDKLLACPDIDSISYEFQKKETENPDVNYAGIQFFVNTDCSGEYAKNFRWEMEETWEYHAEYEILAYFDGRIHESLPGLASDDYFYCWQTAIIRSIYTYSTQNLTSGQIRNYPLHFVSNQSERLSIKYSTLVKQFSLSREAFKFWNILDQQSKQSGELYETQPAQIPGNIHPQDESGETVLGLFYATSVKEKRIILRPAISTWTPNCDLYGLTRSELMELLNTYTPNRYPVYLVVIDMGVYDFADQECFDCRLRGGTVERPDFWE